MIEKCILNLFIKFDENIKLAKKMIIDGTLFLYKLRTKLKIIYLNQ